MSAIVAFNDLNLEISEYQDTWSLSNKQVAEGFGVSEEAIRSQKARNEFKEGVHFYLLQNATGNAKQTFWTKKGVITLGFKLTETPQTVAFRDWASDYILTGHGSPRYYSKRISRPASGRRYSFKASRHARRSKTPRVQSKNRRALRRFRASR